MRLIPSVLFILITSSLSLSAQINQLDAKGKKIGFWKKTDSLGVVKYEGTFISGGIPQGKFTYYYDNGLKKAETTFSEKGLVARTLTFHPDGLKKMSEGKYVNEKKDSVWNYYNTEGTLISTEVYTKGVKNGAFISYFPNGQKTEEKTYKNDTLNGVHQMYFEDGKLRSKVTFVKGKEQGIATYYQSDGKKQAEGKYVDGLRQGAWIFYKPDGTLEKTLRYNKGQTYDPKAKRETIKRGTKYTTPDPLKATPLPPAGVKTESPK